MKPVRANLEMHQKLIKGFPELLSKVRVKQGLKTESTPEAKESAVKNTVLSL